MPNGKKKKKKLSGAEKEFEDKFGISFADFDPTKARAEKEKLLAGKGPGGIPSPRQREEAERGVIAKEKAKPLTAEAIATAPEEFGLQRPADIEPILPVEQPPITEPALERRGLLETLALGPEAPEGTQIAAGALPIGVGGVGKVAKVGGKIIADPSKAVKAATAAKNAVKSGGVIKKIRDGAVALVAGAFGIEKISNLVFNRKVDDQQQALNTLGQITSTIVGDSKTGAGDFQKGLDELRNLKSAVLELESAIKSGEIAEKTLSIRGQIIDINADIFDQLSTIDEGIRDLQDFALTGRFPELTPFEIQQMLRELEAEGHIEPVDLIPSRRPTT